MSEFVNTYNKDDTGICFPMKRNLFYEEQIEKHKEKLPLNKYVEVVNVFLFNERGQLVVQKRSSKKKHNANIMDKSIGGHISAGDDANYTVMVESVQELQVPSLVLNNESDFKKTYKLLKGYTKTISILQYIDTQFFEMSKKINGEDILVGNKSHIYFGIYGGSVKNVDDEAKGILFYDLNELEQEIKEFPNTFTYDLKFYLNYYKKNIGDFLGNIL